VKIFYPTGTRTPAPPGRPARSQSLYRLSTLIDRNKFVQNLQVGLLVFKASSSGSTVISMRSGANSDLMQLPCCSSTFYGRLKVGLCVAVAANCIISTPNFRECGSVRSEDEREDTPGHHVRPLLPLRNRLHI
jgi:hypothetical protein